MKLRIVVGPEITIQFRVKQLAYQDIRITNLSADGCFATIPRAENMFFRQGTLLEMFWFGNPELAGDPITAKVAYVLGGQGNRRGGLELTGLGIHFESMTASMGETLERYIAARAHPSGASGSQNR